MDRILLMVDTANVIFPVPTNDEKFQNIFSSSPNMNEISTLQNILNITINHVLIYRLNQSVPFSGYISNVKRDGSTEYIHVVNGIRLNKK